MPGHSLLDNSFLDYSFLDNSFLDYSLSKFRVEIDADSGPLLGMYFDVEVKKNLLLFRLALAIMCIKG